VACKIFRTMLLFSVLYVACLCAAGSTNFDAPSMHVTCNEKLK